MTVRITTEGEEMKALLVGEIDHHSAREARERIDAQVEKTHPKLLILDFAEIGFMDSSGIGLIMGRHRLMNELGGTLRIENTSRTVSRMIKMAGLGRLSIETGGTKR
ncbi:MAG: STAS domain-containing protein [Oscillospiraceae bacterium]|jgi:stage II sporulation protein AA (anti-sigma F factor antagonist)|nr:STAS domain-containing protein [Oscillospiraceae bacterium]